MTEINFKELDNDTLIELLKKGSWEERRNAARALGDRGATNPNLVA